MPCRETDALKHAETFCTQHGIQPGAGTVCGVHGQQLACCLASWLASVMLGGGKAGLQEALQVRRAES